MEKIKKADGRESDRLIDIIDRADKDAQGPGRSPE